MLASRTESPVLKYDPHIWISIRFHIQYTFQYTRSTNSWFAFISASPLFQRQLQGLEVFKSSSSVDFENSRKTLLKFYCPYFSRLTRLITKWPAHRFQVSVWLCGSVDRSSSEPFHYRWRPYNHACYILPCRCYKKVTAIMPCNMIYLCVCVFFLLLSYIIANHILFYSKTEYGYFGY